MKRLHLHIKEIETKIENFCQNLRYEIKKNKKKQNISINNNKDFEDEKTLNENDIIENKDEDEEDSFDIRRNTLEIKKKNNNQISLIQKLGKSLKNDYSIKKSQRFNTIDKNLNNDSSFNINSESKRYENIKTLNEDSFYDYKEKKISFINKVKKSIQFKEYLLKMAQNRSQKYMEIKKAEIRSLNMARNKKSQKNKYIDISAIFNVNKFSKDKNQYGKMIIGQDQRKDFILNTIINNINKSNKCENLLIKSYISKNKFNNDIKENKKKEEMNKKFGDKMEENNKEIINNNITYNESNFFSFEEKQGIYKKNKSIQVNKKDKEIKYPLIKYNLRNIIKERMNNDNSNNLFESRNIVTLDGLNTLEDRTLSLSKSSRKIFKKYNYNIIISNNNKKKFNYLNLLKNINNNISPKKESKLIQNKLPNIISIYNKEKVNYFDPFIPDNYSHNKKFKTMDK